MTRTSNDQRSVNELIERSSLGSSQARAVRQTVPSALAAKLVARSATRGTQPHSRSKKHSSR